MLDGDEIKHFSAADIEEFVAPASSKISFTGKVDESAYVYLAQVVEPSRTVTTYLDGEAIYAEAGETIRVPAEGWLDVPTEDITVVKALAVTWPDRSLGCPEPGMAYIQVQVDGALVVLEAGGRRYEYHGGDPLALCEQAK